MRRCGGDEHDHLAGLDRAAAVNHQHVAHVEARRSVADNLLERALGHARIMVEVQRFDRQLAGLLEELERRKELDNTLVVVTSDNGMPFPRAKANLYDSGTHMPLAIRWPQGAKAGLVVEPFVSLLDLAPTFLQAAGIVVASELPGRSLLPLLAGKTEAGARDRVFSERERHANVRRGDLSYPARAIRTAQKVNTMP